MAVYYAVGFILAAVVWVLCAYMAYQTAPKFGRWAGTWGVLGIIFGPIALMILYILPKHPVPLGMARRRADAAQGSPGRVVRGPQEAPLTAGGTAEARAVRRAFPFPRGTVLP